MKAVRSSVACVLDVDGVFEVARPKREFTDKQVEQMCRYALAGCQNNTIATLMDIPIETLRRRFGKLLTKKRCERKLKLRNKQNKLADSNPAMAIFLGKNELGQADRHELQHSVSEETISLLSIIDGSTKGKLPNRKEAEEAR